jgi:hypothetical protein
MLAITGALGFLVRNAFAKVESGLEGLSTKLDAMSKDIAKGDGDRRVIEAQLASLQRTVDRLEREVESLGVAR